MTRQTFKKTLSANDTGESGGHQAGILVPKGDADFLSFLPELGNAEKNPRAWIECKDPDGRTWDFCFIYYNNKHHDPGGTRDEYRITHMTKFLKSFGATKRDEFVITGEPGSSSYLIAVEKSPVTENKVARIVLKGWRRVH
ncbi:EcoRII N-terminal effector-binding domain-containing protein [Pararhizobium sp. IMCC21322]|uniref:EcoRII N-terminal effector-binding domain-containing protein n=1 Tax=Pararhizobium sp. IMCC21322 TaxID=3067903 RepID=UPI0027424F2D|nr:EcoRII N-terminal effector-binding domain-containing protein [Pararhizobium sp. IMCC21322]